MMSVCGHQRAEGLKWVEVCLFCFVGKLSDRDHRRVVGHWRHYCNENDKGSSDYHVMILCNFRT